MDLGNLVWWPFMMLIGSTVFAIGILVLIFWIWMIIDCAQRKFKNDTEKIIWIIVIVLGNWIGALVYFITIKILNVKGLTK